MQRREFCGAATIVWPHDAATTRARLKAGELGLDIYAIRDKLTQKGLVYRP